MAFFHIIFAKFASGAFLIALSLSVSYCLKIRNAGAAEMPEEIRRLLNLAPIP